jgi:hypothetical protein
MCHHPNEHIGPQHSCALSVPLIAGLGYAIRSQTDGAMRTSPEGSRAYKWRVVSLGPVTPHANPCVVLVVPVVPLGNSALGKRAWLDISDENVMLKENTDVGRELTDDEVVRLLAACKAGISRHLYPAVLISIHTGLRK